MREISGKDKLKQPSTESSDPEEAPMGSRNQTNLTTPGDTDGGGGGSGAIDPVMVFVLLAAGRGIGNIIAGPMSQAMYSARFWEGEVGLAYGSGFGSLIAFTGITALGSGICFLGRRVGWC